MRKIVLVSLAVSLLLLAAAAWAASTPTVVTGSATSITNSGAQLHASVNPEGTSTQWVFEYGPTVAYGSLTATGNVASGTKAVSVSKTLAGLDPGTLYHYRIEATSKFGTAFGSDQTFTTSGHPLPAAITGVPSAIGKTTVTLTGTVVTEDETTSAYFEYGPTTAYGLQTFATSVTAGTTPTGVSLTIPDLSPGTTVHYRLVADHAGTAPEYGSDETFTTIPYVRFRPRVSAHTTPGHARRKPYLFTTVGKVARPGSLPAGVGCTGAVGVRFFLGNRSVAFRRASVQANCTFSAPVRFRRLVDHTKSQLRVEVHFDGNSYLRAAGAKAQRVRLG